MDDKEVTTDQIRLLKTLCESQRWSDDDYAKSFSRTCDNWLGIVEHWRSPSPDEYKLKQFLIAENLRKIVEVLQRGLNANWHFTDAFAEDPQLATRLQLVDDALAFMQRGQLSYEQKLAKERAAREVDEARLVASAVVAATKVEEFAATLSEKSEAMELAFSRTSAAGTELATAKSDWATATASALSECQKISEMLSQALREIESFRGSIVDFNAEIEGCKSSWKDVVSSGVASNEQAAANIADIERNTAEAISELQNALDALKSVRADTTRQGLAGEFEKQREKLRRSVIWATVGMLVSWGAIAVYASYLVSLDEIPDSWPELVFRLVPGMAVGFLGWTFGRRASVLMQILEDYRFKAATAKSFEGYKREVGDAGELREELLRKVINSIGENPTRFAHVSKNEGHTPATAAGSAGIDAAQSLLKQITELTKLK